jgi:hypothetical protein
MTEPTIWQESNARYLAAAVASVRSRLENRVSGRRETRELALREDPAAIPTAPSRESEEVRPFWRMFARRPEAAKPAALAPPSGITDKGAATHIADDLSSLAASANGPPALQILSQRLGLSRFEEEVLLLCVATELDTGIASLCARAQGDPARSYPTFALALTLFNEPSWDALSPERPLRYWRLIEINQPAASPLTVSPIRADERVVNYLKGLNYLDDRLIPMVTPLPAVSGAPADSHRLIAERLTLQLRAVTTGRKLPAVELIGPDRQSKELVAGIVSDSLGLRAYRMHSSTLPAAAADLETLARLWHRESLLLPIALYLDASGADPGAGNALGNSLNRLIERVNAMIFVDVRDVWELDPSTMVDVAKPTVAEQRTIWASALGADAATLPSSLAGQFDLSAEAIRDIATNATAETTPPTPLDRRLWNACLASTRPRLDLMAQRIEPMASWGDLVLPAAETRLLRQIADQVGMRGQVYEEWGFAERSSRGLGISALFAGDSGTGKTMAAEVLADHLRLNLYRIDLSAVVSKYIGETEKNLRRLFDAAEDGGTILFFDEADALFGKRSEVKDSHDRYANIEINYLLQRMEAYRGLAILATNMKSALDAAFLRRLRFVVNFPFPGVAERKAIWQRAFPPATPTEALDFDRVARLNVAGGNIRTIAVNAAFAAAQAGTAVTMPLLLAAARDEFRKLERPINEPDFRWPPVKAA